MIRKSTLNTQKVWMKMVSYLFLRLQIWHEIEIFILASMTNAVTSLRSFFLISKASCMVKSHFIYVAVTKNQLFTYEIDTSHGFKLMTAPILIYQGASLLQVSPTYHVLTLQFKSGCRSPLPPLFSCEFCKKSKNTFSCRTPLVAASLFVIYSNNTQIERTLA